MAHNAIILYHEIDVSLYQSQFFEWLLANKRLYFLFVTRIHGVTCCVECSRAFRGLNDNIKVILIDPSLEIEIMALLTVFYRENPALRCVEEAGVSDRSCPFCGA